MPTDNQNPEQSANGRLLSEFPVPSFEEWMAQVNEQLKGVPFEKKLVTKTYEGIDLQPLYRQDDAAGLSHLEAMPGFPPYVRGSRAGGYSARPWFICQELAYSTAEEFNEAVLYDLERGQTAVNLLVDKATQLGQDPDEAAVGDVGLGGVSIATVDDLARALKGIDLEQIRLFFGATSAAVPTAAMLMALVRHEGKATEKLHGSLEMDPLGTLAREGELPRSVAGAYDVMAHLLTWAKSHAPELDIITIHGQPYSDAGASAVQELAFALSTAVEYLREMIARGLSVDDVAPRIRFAFSLGANYFMEVAKLRAAKLVWARVVKAFGGSEESQKMTIHARTAAYTKTVQDPYVNMLRVTTEAFAGAVGGCDSMHTSQFDEAIRQPDEFSRRIARNTQIILQQEAHLSRVIDPAGGSWYVENLTDTLARKAWALFQAVEKQGGMYAALQAGSPQEQVAQTAAARAKNLAVRKDVLVGTNKYANLQELPLEPRRPDYAALHQARSEYIETYRTKLDNEQSTAVLDKLAKVMDAEGANVLEAAIEAALAGATLGELARTLRQDDHSKATVTPLKTHRISEMFEALRGFADDYQAKHGHRPQVFLANMGPIPKHKPRADFSTDFFQVGGFEILGNDGFDTPEKAAQAAIDSGAPIVVICGTDDMYPDVVPPITKAIKAAKAGVKVILAGYPQDQIEAHKAAGVDEFIHVRANTYDILSRLQKELAG